MAIKTIFEEEQKLSDNVRSNHLLMPHDRALGTFMQFHVNYSDHRYWASVSIVDKTETKYEDGLGFIGTSCSIFEDTKTVNLFTVQRVNKTDSARAVEIAKEWLADIKADILAHRFQPFAQ